MKTCQVLNCAWCRTSYPILWQFLYFLFLGAVWTIQVLPEFIFPHHGLLTVYSRNPNWLPIHILGTIGKFHAQIQRGEGGGSRGSRPPPPLKNYKNIGFLSNTGPDPLNNHKATKPAFNVGISLVGQWWSPYSGIWILPPLIIKKN